MTTKNKKKTTKREMEERSFSEEAKFFEENGYAIVKGFASGGECKGMMERMKELVEGWYKTRKEEGVHVFTTGKVFALFLSLSFSLFLSPL